MTDSSTDFTEFMRERRRPLFRFAMVLCGDPHLADQLVSDTLSKAWERWSNIAAMDRPNAYLRRMIVNQYLRTRQRLHRLVPRASLTDLIDERTAVADHADEQVERDLMITALAGLPRMQRAALVLRFYDARSDPEIAEILGCRPVTVRSNISRALRTLRVRLDDTSATRGATSTSPSRVTQPTISIMIEEFS